MAILGQHVPAKYPFTPGTQTLDGPL